MNLVFDIRGVKEVREVLATVTPRHARNIARNTVYGVAAEVRDEVKKNAPVDRGELRRSVAAKTVRSPPDKPAAIMYFKPSGFHWRFVESGTTRTRSYPFVTPAVNRMRARVNEVIIKRFKKAVENAVKRELKKRAK